jgi:hypothetical protein
MRLFFYMSIINNETFLSGLQCHKQLWLNEKESKSISSKNDNYYLETCEAIEHREVIEHAKTFLSDRYDTLEIGHTLTYDNFKIVIDLCQIHKDGSYSLIIAKPTLHTRRHHIMLMGFWHAILTAQDINVRDMLSVNLKSNYTLVGDLNLNELLSVTPIDKDVYKTSSAVQDILNTLIHVLTLESCPNIDIGFHCDRPHDCSYFKQCSASIPCPSVFDIFGLPKKTKYSLYRRGYAKYEDALKKITPDDIQTRQAEAELEGKSIINKAHISEFLSHFKFPLFFIDFEAVQFTIPKYQNTKPFQQVPFQYSMHYFNFDGDVIHHRDFLAETGEDPRRPFSESLVEHLGTEGTILAFNSNFETQTISAMAELFPDLAESLMTIQKRFIDLATPFNKMDYYVKDMRGKRSIKALFHAVTNDLPYDNLSIMNGEAASKVYGLLSTIKNTDEHVQIRADLLRYCHMDTIAMVRLWQNLVLSILN